LKELDLSWCHGFTNTGLLAYGTYLCAHQYKNHHSNNDDYHDYHIYHHFNEDDYNLIKHNTNDYHINNNDDNNNNENIRKITTASTITPTCLEKLSIEWCSQITDEAMNVISSIISLKSIYITGCSGITEEGLMCLKRKGIDIC